MVEVLRKKGADQVANRDKKDLDPGDQRHL